MKTNDFETTALRLSAELETGSRDAQEWATETRDFLSRDETIDWCLKNNVTLFTIGTITGKVVQEIQEEQHLPGTLANMLLIAGLATLYYTIAKDLANAVKHAKFDNKATPADLNKKIAASIDARIPSPFLSITEALKKAIEETIVDLHLNMK